MSKFEVIINFPGLQIFSNAIPVFVHFNLSGSSDFIG